ncbi:MAG: hypothetical protein ACI31R_04355 [Bacilli bacterium]
MNEFISEFGKENFVIIIAIVFAIVLALIIIVLIEKFQAKSRMKKQIRKQISNMNAPSNDFKNQVIRENIPKHEQVEVLEEDYTKHNDEVVYVEEVNPELEAKEKLEEVTKKLIEKDDGLIDHTHFETEQEEKSIISYDELVRASHDIDEKNDKLLEDEGEAAITLEELYQKHVDDQNLVEESKVDVRVNNPVFEDDEPKKFKNSEVISPVFGFYSGKTKQEQLKPKEVFEELDKSVEMKDLEDEIQRTEDFLSELKRLKNKLD